MAMRTITRLFDTRDHAMAAVRDLEAAGFRHEDVSILANNAEGQRSDVATAPGGRAGDHTELRRTPSPGPGSVPRWGRYWVAARGSRPGLGPWRFRAWGPWWRRAGWWRR